MNMSARGWVLLTSVLLRPAPTLRKAFGSSCAINHGVGRRPSGPGDPPRGGDGGGWGGERGWLAAGGSVSSPVMWGETLGGAASPQPAGTGPLLGGGHIWVPSWDGDPKSVSGSLGAPPNSQRALQTASPPKSFMGAAAAGPPLRGGAGRAAAARGPGAIWWPLDRGDSGTPSGGTRSATGWVSSTAPRGWKAEGVLGCAADRGCPSRGVPGALGPGE